NEKEQRIKSHLWIKEVLCECITGSKFKRRAVIERFRLEFHHVFLQEWMNPFLTWSPEEFDGIREISVPTSMVWIPDIILYNNADDRNDGVKKTNRKITVQHDGKNIWRSPVIYNSMCVLDVKYFPFDEQTCDLIFASWSRDARSLNLVLGNNEVTRSPKDTKFFQENEEWRVLFVKIKRQEVAMYYSVSIMEIGTALAATCIILNIYHRKTVMPGWFRKIVLCWLAPLVRCKPRCTSKEMMDTRHEEAMLNMLSFKSSDVRRNEVYDFDRESREFEMDVLEVNAQGRSTQREQHAPNGSVPCNNVMTRRHSLRCGQDEDISNQEPLPSDPLYTHRMQLSERLNEDIRRKEWQDSARVLDRVLLVASVVIGSASAMAIFLQSPRIRGFFTLS
ncbi:hypothetical protein QZH41_017908, partial [Actinostola sp. cb2023]